MFEVRKHVPFRFAISGGELIVSGRFATELAGRKARRKGWDGLAEEMNKAGWFEA